LKLLALYLGMAVVGYMIGARIRNKKWTRPPAAKAATFAALCLVFVMGSRIGADERVVANLSTIGVNALILTLATFVGSVLFVILARKLVGINRKGIKS
jgi:uncharacterized membrane protein YbjE (DUF340 family)